MAAPKFLPKMYFFKDTGLIVYQRDSGSKLAIKLQNVLVPAQDPSEVEILQHYRFEGGLTTEFGKQNGWCKGEMKVMADKTHLHYLEVYKSQNSPSYGVAINMLMLPNNDIVYTIAAPGKVPVTVQITAGSEYAYLSTLALYQAIASFLTDETATFDTVRSYMHALSEFSAYYMENQDTLHVIDVSPTPIREINLRKIGLLAASCFTGATVQGANQVFLSTWEWIKCGVILLACGVAAFTAPWLVASAWAMLGITVGAAIIANWTLENICHFFDLPTGP